MGQSGSLQKWSSLDQWLPESGASPSPTWAKVNKLSAKRVFLSGVNKNRHLCGTLCGSRSQNAPECVCVCSPCLPAAQALHLNNSPNKDFQKKVQIKPRLTQHGQLSESLPLRFSEVQGVQRQHLPSLKFQQVLPRQANCEIKQESCPRGMTHRVKGGQTVEDWTQQIQTLVVQTINRGQVLPHK